MMLFREAVMGELINENNHLSNRDLLEVYRLVSTDCKLMNFGSWCLIRKDDDPGF